MDERITPALDTEWCPHIKQCSWSAKNSEIFFVQENLNWLEIWILI
jgi:hypothetical protein